MTMMLSGAYVTPEEGVPMLTDIAHGLAKMPRFGGQTLFDWTVADHLNICMRYAVQCGEEPLLVLQIGMHDAHEALTSDITTDFKTPDMRKLQAKLDTRLYGFFGVPLPDMLGSIRVKTYDLNALLAESFVVCPRHTYEKIRGELGGMPANPSLVDLIQRYIHEDVASGREWLRHINFLRNGGTP